MGNTIANTENELREKVSELTKELDEKKSELNDMINKFGANMYKEKYSNQIKIINEKFVRSKNLSKEISGKEFKKIMGVYNNYFIKVMNNDMNNDATHDKYVYKEGLNIYQKGLHFTTINNVKHFYDVSQNIHFRPVDIPDDAKVYNELSNEWKADKIILGEKIDKFILDIYIKFSSQF